VEDCGLGLVMDGSGPKIFDQGRVIFLTDWSGQLSRPGSGKFHTKIPTSQFLFHQVWSKNIWVKPRLAPYLLRVRSMLWWAAAHKGWTPDVKMGML